MYLLQDFENYVFYGWFENVSGQFIESLIHLIKIVIDQVILISNIGLIFIIVVMHIDTSGGTLNYYDLLRFEMNHTKKVLSGKAAIDDCMSCFHAVGVVIVVNGFPYLDQSLI